MLNITQHGLVSVMKVNGHALHCDYNPTALYHVVCFGWANQSSLYPPPQMHDSMDMLCAGAELCAGQATREVLPVQKWLVSHGTQMRILSMISTPA